jgi:cytochrome c oxidase subunit 2
MTILFTPAPASFDLPPAISTEAGDADWLYNFLYWFSMIFWVALTAAMLYWAYKYKRGKNDKRIPTGHYPRLEAAWTILPVFFIIWLFHVGFSAYIKTAIAADNAMEIRVRGQKWFWTFTYPNGTSVNNDLYLPVGKPVKFVISASDVLHSFYIPGARMKKDAVPGMYTGMTFTPTELGDTPIYCAEYCGAPDTPAPPLKSDTGWTAPLGGHSGMMAMIHVVSQEEYEKHTVITKPDGITEAQWGEKLYKENACMTCHTVDGSKGTGPTWKGMWGNPVALNADLSGGVGTATVDDNYVRESILKPNAKVVAGFNPVMPPYTLSDKQIDAIIEYQKTLK